ncbi:hypothetical protein [Nocardioides mesophilus]|uniref:Terpene cyclase/mutase family protein n=1 Tax=Nocardioides mesophilus TaxID=433659 RepID=A0A7G9R8W9_9ACTN|nr:hypothetical protein [Nocardioides mesophilus]QNN52044.1 hypothetical protein H9L09_16230 [Nocardioides mesophilus]
MALSSATLTGLALAGPAPAALAAPAAAVSAPAATSAGSAASLVPDGADPRPVLVGADWLTGQLDASGLLHNDQYDFADYGLTADAGFALDAAGGHQGAVTAITDALAAHVDSYTTGVDFDAPDDVYAGAVAKVLSLATSQDRDPRTFGGEDLVSRMESVVLTGGRLNGRIKDVSAYGDYSNTIGQAFAARGLTAAGSPLADDATGFLLQQQCLAGYFRLTFAAETAAEQSCNAGVRADDPAGQADPDATSLATLQLIRIAALPGLDPALATRVDDAIGAATTWLRSRQQRNGALGGGTATEAANTNSTGLAGWVFGEAGETSAARRAAAWVRARQADEPRRCPSGLTAETGAIGYDDASVAAGRTGAIPVESRDQWRRASTQALPALRWAPAAAAPALRGPRDYVRAGRDARLVATGTAPGSRVCFVRGAKATARTAGSAGRAAADLRMPWGTRETTVSLRTGAGTIASTTVSVLGRARFSVELAQRSVPRRGIQTVTATGLAPGESVVVRYRGEQVRRTEADRRGRLTTRFRVGSRLGEVTVRVLGEFPHRDGAATFTVRR